MDAIEDILKHPAYPSVRKWMVDKKRSKVSTLLNKLQSLIHLYQLSGKTSPDPDGFEHYNGCDSKFNPERPDDDFVGTCICCHVNMRRNVIINLLDDIHALEGNSCD